MTTILLLDDDPFQAYQRQAILRQQFSDVQRISDPAEGLCLVEQPQFCTHLGVVVCALGRHSSISGPDFVAEMQERLPRLPVLVLGSPADKATDYPGSWVWYLPSPVSDSDLLLAAGELLMRYSWKSA